MELIKTVHAQATQDLGVYYGFGNYQDFGQLFSIIVGTVFGLVGVLLVLYILWGGYKWLSSGGSKDGIAAAQSMITHAVIGIVLLVLLFIIFRVVPEFFGIDLHIFN